MLRERLIATLSIMLLYMTQAMAAGKHYEDRMGKASVVDGYTLDT